MPVVTVNVSDADYQDLRSSKNKSAKLRSMLEERRTHKCPPPPPPHKCPPPPVDKDGDDYRDVSKRARLMKKGESFDWKLNDGTPVSVRRA